MQKLEIAAINQMLEFYAKDRYIPLKHAEIEILNRAFSPKANPQIKQFLQQRHNKRLPRALLH
jgi:hypothetical protein